MDKQKILIVEDERLVALDLKNKVSELNYEVIDLAFTGEEAVEKTLTEMPNIILMDINLGEDMDGIDAAREIRQHADIPVIYVTANADMGTVERARSTEPYGYINKPVNIRDLHTCIDSALYRHSMKLQLYESEKKFRQIFDNATDGICISDINSLSIFLANRMFSRMTGYGSEELADMSLGSLFPEDSLKTVKDELEKIVTHTTGEVKQIPMMRKDNGIFYADITACLITLGSGRYIMGIFRDITETKVYEDALRKSEERFRNIVESSPMGIHMYELDRNGNLLFTGANESANLILGLDNSRFIGKTLEKAFPSFAETEVPDKFKLTASTGSPWSTEHIACEESPISGIFEIFAFQTEKNKMAAMFMDVTEKRKAEKEIREKNEKLAVLNIELKTVIEEHEAANEELVNARDELIRREAFLESLFRVAPVGIGTTKKGVIGWMNKMLTEITGYSEEELSGASMSLLYEDVQRHETVEKKIREQIFEEGRGSMETEWIRKDGKRVYVLYSATKIRRGEQEDEITFTVQDITERKHSYDILIQSEKMMTVGGLAAGMAHELNNPLGIILQGVQMIRKRIDCENPENRNAAVTAGLIMKALHEYLEKQKVLEYIRNIYDAGVRAADIVADMMKFTRKSEADIRNADLNELIGRAIKIVTKDYDLVKNYDVRSIKFKKVFDKNLPLLTCSESEIEQVLVNILKNSSQDLFESDGFGAKPEFIIKTSSDDNSVIIEISDNGPGMDEDTANRLFEPFSSKKGIGNRTGLGMYIAYFIITNNHQGEISVESGPGKGVKFLIKLPRREDEYARTL